MFAYPTRDQKRQASQLSIRDRIPGASYIGMNESTRGSGTEYPNNNVDNNLSALDFVEYWIWIYDRGS